MKFNINLLPKVTLWALLLIGIVMSALFFIGGDEAIGLEVAGDTLNIPVFTSLFLVWNYILLSLTILVTLGVVIKAFVDQYKADQKKAIRSLIIVCSFVVIALACWFMGSSEKMNIIGYEGTDNEGAMAQLTDAMMYFTYILFAGVIGAIIWGAVYTRKK